MLQQLKQNLNKLQIRNKHIQHIDLIYFIQDNATIIRQIVPKNTTLTNNGLGKYSQFLSNKILDTYIIWQNLVITLHLSLRILNYRMVEKLSVWIAFLSSIEISKKFALRKVF